MSKYTILSTIPTTYNDPVEGVVNGVLVRFRLDAYNEVHEVRIPKPDTQLAIQAVEKVVAFRDELAGLSSSTTK